MNSAMVAPNPAGWGTKRLKRVLSVSGNRSYLRLVWG
jgi:hypothetical protein